MTSKSSSTFVRSDPSALVITLLEEEQEYRSSAQLAKDEKKLLDEKIRCTACNKHMKNILTKGDVRFHPSFEVIICKDCEVFYASGEFSVDEDGSDKYCRWCGQGGSLYCCSKCSVAICEKCVKINFPRTYRTEIEDDEWKCFICDPKPIWPHRALAAAVREYVDKQKPNRKQKRHSSDDSDSNSSPKSKRARNDSSDEQNSFSEKSTKRKSSRKSKIVIDSSNDDDTESKSKRSKEKKKKSLRKSSRKSIVTISDDNDSENDNSPVANRSKKEKSKTDERSKTKDSTETDEVSEDYDYKSRRSSKKSRVDYKEKDDANDSHEGQEKTDSNKSRSTSSTSRRSKKLTDDDLDSDKSVFRDKNSSKRTARKSQVTSKSSLAASQKSTCGGSESIDSDSVRLFQHLLQQSLKDVDKFVKIIVDRITSFRNKYINSKQHLRNSKEAGVVKEKYIAFLGNMASTAKRIESTFISDVEPLISITASKQITNKMDSDGSSPRKSTNGNEFLNGVEDKSSADVTEKNVSETKVSEKKVSSTKMEVDNDKDVKTEVDEFENTSGNLNNSAETSRRESASSLKNVSDKENNLSLSSNKKEEMSTEEGEKSLVEVMENNPNKDDDDEIALGNASVSDSMIVNLGTEDESISSEKCSRTVENSGKENSDDESDSTKKLSDGFDNSQSLNNGGKKDVNASTIDSDDEHSKSKEEFAKNDLLQNSESSSDNETKKCDKKLKKFEEGDCSVPFRSPSPGNKFSDIAETKEKQAKSDLLNESDEVDKENGEKSQDIGDSHAEDCSESKEKKAKSELLKSSDSSLSDQHSKSSSDSGMSGVDVLKKSSDGTKSRQKRRTKRLSNNLEVRQGKDSDDEDKEINRLTNLKSLERRKTRTIVAESSEDEIHSDSEKENLENQSNMKKRVKKTIPKKSLEDYVSDGSDNCDTDDDDDPFYNFNRFLDEKKFKNSTMTQNDFCKQQLLNSSDSNDGNESDVEDELIFPSKPKKEQKLRTSEYRKKEADQSSNSNDESSSENDKKKKKQASWRNDPLLTNKLTISDSSDDEKIAERIRKREEKDKAKNKDSCNSSDSGDLFRTKPASSVKKKRKTLKSSSDESSSSSVQIIEKKETRKRKHKRKRIKNLWSDSDDDSDKDKNNSQNTQESASKGRKNIRKLLTDKELAEETQISAKQEEARKKRIAERQSLFNEVFKVVDMESETPTKLVLDFDPETKTELVSVHPNLVKKLKPHQVQGIKFMWDSCFESLKEIENSRGSGCVLAHCMGLGKTLQVVALVHTILRYPATKVKTVLVICPVSTILNWVKEFKTWLDNLDDDGECDIDIWHFNKSQRNAKERAFLLKRWSEDGGVMILGYDMFRTLVNSKTLVKKWKDSIHEALLDPGADLVVCDEGHTLKNEKSAISVAAMKIRTRRRIVLTGTPLQNNLIEYHCMVQFVKPNLLGDKKEFQNRFANPITNGQFTNSTAHDVRLMKRRSHVLHKMLDGIVQRFDYNVLTPFLPPKHEFVISVALSDLQATLYEHYIKTYSCVSNNGQSRTLFKDYQIMRLIWTHPFAMNKSFEKRMKLEAEKEEKDSIEDFVVDESEESSSGNSVISVHSDEDTNPPKKTFQTRTKTNADPLEDAEPELEIDPKAGAWWRPFITDEDIDNYKQGPKLVLLFAILRECELIGDKVLIFSQSIPSLDMIEHFLQKTDEFSQYDSLLDAEGDADYIGTWRKNIDYFRLDGSTPSELRTDYTNRFNHPSNNRARLFLISTKAGGLGINLTAANRVIIFDASWNPSHDVQSIFRVYRFGQKKPCYIYRFLSQGTMEEKIYGRQVTKLSISCRVVDEQQIDRHFSRNEIEELYTFARKSPSEDEIPKLPKDRLMAEMLKKFKNLILSYHEHDSLLENIVDEELTEEERKQAWEEYENDKKPRPQPIPSQFRQDAPNVSDETIIRSIKLQNPNATPEQLEDMTSKVRSRIMQYYAEQQRMLFLNQQHNAPNIQVVNKKELDEQLEMRRRALKNNLLMNQEKTNSLQNQNPGYTMAVAGYPQPMTPTKMGISSSKYGSYASPVKRMPPLGSSNRTPLKHVNDLSPNKRLGDSDDEGVSMSTNTAVSWLEQPSTFKPLETPSTWAFRWTTPRSLSYLEGVLKANCRFLARYERVGENVLMHLPFCVRADTLKQKLADHLADISFRHVSPVGLDEQDVLDIIVSSTRPTVESDFELRRH